MLIFRGFLTPNSSKIDHVYWGGNGFGYHWVWIEICGSQNFKWIQLNHQYLTLVAKISSASLTSTLLLKSSLLRFLLVAWILYGFFRCQFLATSITVVQFPIKQVGPCDFGTSTSIMWTHRRVPRRPWRCLGPCTSHWEMIRSGFTWLHMTSFKRCPAIKLIKRDFSISDHAPVFIIKQMLSPFSRMRPGQRWGLFGQGWQGTLFLWTWRVKHGNRDWHHEELGFWSKQKTTLGSFLPQLRSNHLTSHSESWLKRGIGGVGDNSRYPLVN